MTLSWAYRQLESIFTGWNRVCYSGDFSGCGPMGGLFSGCDGILGQSDTGIKDVVVMGRYRHLRRKHSGMDGVLGHIGSIL